MEFMSYSEALEQGIILERGETENGVGVGWDDRPQSFDVIAWNEETDEPEAL